MAHVRLATRSSLTISLLVVWSCLGCMTVRVHREPDSTGKPKKLKGVPFYVQSERITKHSVYMLPTIVAELKVFQARVEGDKEVPVGSPITYAVRTIDTREARESLNDVRRMLVALVESNNFEAGARLKDITDKFNTIAAKPEVEPNKNLSPEAVLVANFHERSMHVDYTKTYYLNSRRPVFGSGSLNAELAANGTLAKTLATADSDLGEDLASVATGIATLAPVSEFFSAKWVPKADDTTTAAVAWQTFLNVPRGADPAGFLTRAELAVTNQPVLYDFFQDESAGLTAAALAPSTGSHLFRRSVPVSAAPKETPKNTISFDGTLRLPEPPAAKKP